MRQISVAQNAYFRLLGSSNGDDLAERVVRAILAAVQQHQGVGPPISLSCAAEDFMICPLPTFDESVPGGRVDFDPGQGRFVITLNGGSQRGSIAAFQKQSVALISRKCATPDLGLIYRARFTYAHEVAHRFFFIERDGGWVRAMQLVASETEHSMRLRVLKALHRLEETLCDRIAGDVLVPSSQLFPALGGEIFAMSGAGPVAFPKLLQDLSRLFAVSKECILVRLERAVRYKQIACPENFCALLLAFSNEKSSAGRSRWDVRVRIGIVPKVLKGVPVRPIFPGLAVENLAPQASEFRELVLGGQIQQRGISLNLPLTLLKAQSKEEESALRSTLKGWAVALNWARHPSQHDTSILVWGFLDPWAKTAV